MWGMASKKGIVLHECTCYEAEIEMNWIEFIWVSCTTSDHQGHAVTSNVEAKVEACSHHLLLVWLDQLLPSGGRLKPWTSHKLINNWSWGCLKCWNVIHVYIHCKSGRKKLEFTPIMQRLKFSFWTHFCQKWVTYFVLLYASFVFC